LQPVDAAATHLAGGRLNAFLSQVRRSDGKTVTGGKDFFWPWINANARDSESANRPPRNQRFAKVPDEPLLVSVFFADSRSFASIRGEF
jgi:hypothetical protein